jgi:hypothetical protein
MAEAKKVEPYYLDPDFERAMTTVACSNPRFWGRIGEELDVDAIESPTCRLALQAAKLVAKENGVGPTNPMVVLQRLRLLMHEGRVKLSEITKVAEMFEDALDAGLPSEEEAVSGIVPILRQRIRADAMRSAIDDYGKKGDFEKTERLIQRARSIGDSISSVGIRLGSGSADAIEAMKHLEKVGMGLPDVDDALRGGLRRGSLGLFLGSPSDGKSMALSHAAAWSARCQMFAAYATLELPPADVLARIKANLLGVPIDLVLEDPHRFVPDLMKLPLGPVIVQAFTPQATTMEDIERWVESCEEQVGRRIDVLLTDYGDKLIAPKNAGKEGEHGYSAGRVVFERMRIYADEGHKGGKIYHWSASQAVRRKDRKHILTLDDVADSMHKVRVADLVLTLNLDDDQMIINVAKNRYGARNAKIGPFPTDFVCGRMGPMLLEGP